MKVLRCRSGCSSQLSCMASDSCRTILSRLMSMCRHWCCLVPGQPMVLHLKFRDIFVQNYKPSFSATHDVSHHPGMSSAIQIIPYAAKWRKWGVCLYRIPVVLHIPGTQVVLAFDLADLWRRRLPWRRRGMMPVPAHISRAVVLFTSHQTSGRRRKAAEGILRRAVTHGRRTGGCLREEAERREGGLLW